jgi:hypothetical protein
MRSPRLRHDAQRPLSDAAQREQNRWPHPEKQQSTSALKHTRHWKAVRAASASALWLAASRRVSVSCALASDSAACVRA